MAISVNVPLATNQILTDYAAMNANWEYVVLSDGTAGRVLRCMRLNVAYNAGANSVEVYTTSVWNGDAIDSSGTPHVITVTDVDTNWGYVTEAVLTIYAAGITGNAVAVFAHITYNKTGESNIMVWPVAVSNNIYLSFYEGTFGGGYALHELASGESLEVDILYITDA